MHPTSEWVSIRVATLGILCTITAGGCAPRAPVATPAPTPSPTPARQAFEATAYSIKGKTASGAPARSGVVAADPRLLPLGSRIRVYGAEQYSGEYTVTDTGRTIKGREIDIFIPDAGEARRFGRRQVEVEVLELGR